MDPDRLRLADARRNATVGWVATAVVALTGVERALAGAYLWSTLTLALVIALALPALATRSPTAMVPWPLPVVAAAAAVLRALSVFPDLSGYLAISTIALILVAELVSYTDVELSRRFAVVFATMTTMALQACWIIVQFYADQWLGTGFLPSQAELQWDIVSVVAVSVVLGVAVELSLGHFEAAGSLDRRSTR